MGIICATMKGVLHSASRAVMEADCFVDHHGSGSVDLYHSCSKGITNATIEVKIIVAMSSEVTVVNQQLPSFTLLQQCVPQ
jgi:hypothetical protein